MYVEQHAQCTPIAPVVVHRPGSTFVEQSSTDGTLTRDEEFQKTATPFFHKKNQDLMVGLPHL